VELEERDPVRPQPPQTLLDRPADELRDAIEGVRGDADLGGEVDPAGEAEVGERPAEVGFRFPLAVPRAVSNQFTPASTARATVARWASASRPVISPDTGPAPKPMTET
jgi:hypothetical protein